MLTYWLNFSLNVLIKHLLLTVPSCWLFIFSLRFIIYLGVKQICTESFWWSLLEFKIPRRRNEYLSIDLGWLLIKVWWCLKTSLVTQASKVPLAGASLANLQLLLINEGWTSWMKSQCRYYTETSLFIKTNNIYQRDNKVLSCYSTASLLSDPRVS